MILCVVDVIDDFIAYADFNNDGYLNYAEYSKALVKNENNDNHSIDLPSNSEY